MTKRLSNFYSVFQDDMDMSGRLRRVKTQVTAFYERARDIVYNLFQFDAYDTEADGSVVAQTPVVTPVRVRPPSYSPIGQPRQHELHLRYFEKSSSERRPLRFLESVREQNPSEIEGRIYPRNQMRFNPTSRYSSSSE